MSNIILPNTFTLDIETAATDKDMQMHAGLEPYRLRQGKAEITSVAVCRPDNTTIQIVNNCGSEWKYRLESLLGELKGEKVYCHNAPFDLAWQIANLQPDRCGAIPQCIRDIRWRDTMLLTKWILNGQLAEDIHFSYSLVNLVAKFLPDHPRTAEFVEMKNRGFRPGENSEYWEARGNLDVIMTKALADYMETKLPASMRVGLMTEFAGLVPIANSWIMGIKVNQDKLDAVGKMYDARMENLAKELEISPSVFTSPKQLGNLLFNTWQLTPIRKTPSGAPGAAKDDLMWLQYHLLNSGNNILAEKLGKVLLFKNTSTLKSKYVKSTYQALEHTGDGHIYGAPRIFATYTGRMSYSSTTTSKDFEKETNVKHKNGIALHQMPRKAKEIREFLEPPESMALYEADASGQESRLMALRSKDPIMLKVFKDNLNFHAMTGASIIGVEYDEFMKMYYEQVDTGGYYVEQRQLGKLANLSCNYRIGGKSLSEKSFINYDTYMSVDTGNYVVKAFNRMYKGVPEYWSDVVWESKQAGYTEAFGGRRFKLTKWSTDRWMTESSAINVPIQGAGASMKEIAVAETFNKVDDALFCLDLHDASFFYVKSELLESKAKELDHVLNNVDYEPYWGFKPEIPMPYESNFGRNFRDVK
jgi:DNA polymerase I-like protein with 3'-5' exonuclease and polymerase domains